MVENRGTIHLWIFSSNLLKITVMCSWDLGSGCFCPAEWGWTEGGDGVWCFCNKGLCGGMGRSAVRMVHQSCPKLKQWGWAFVFPYQLVTGCRLPSAGGVTLAEVVLSLWPQFPPRASAESCQMATIPAAGQWVLTRGYWQGVGQCPIPSTGSGCPGGYLVGLGDTGELILCREGFDGWWEMERHQQINPLLSFPLWIVLRHGSWDWAVCCICCKGVPGLMTSFLVCVLPHFSTSFPYPSFYPWGCTLALKCQHNIFCLSLCFLGNPG